MINQELNKIDNNIEKSIETGCRITTESELISLELVGFIPMNQIDFYDIREYPPKASVRIRTMSGDVSVANDSFSVSLDTLLSGVLETVTVCII